MSKKTLRSFRLGKAGASLLEVLVAVSILSVGGLYVSKLQESATQYNADAKKSFGAFSLARDIENRLRLKNICDASLVGQGTGTFTVQGGATGVVNQGDEIKDIYDGNIGLRIQTLNVESLNANNNEAIIRVGIQKYTAKGNDGKLFRHEFPIKVENDGNTIAGCIDAAEMFQRSVASALCDHLCPSGNGDPLLDDSDCNVAVNTGNTDSLYQKCNLAANEALKQAEKEMCGELGVWDGNQCQPVFSQFTGVCPANQMLVGAVVNSNTVDYAIDNIAANNEKTFAWECEDQPQFQPGARGPATPECTWTAWSPRANEMCQGASYEQTRNCMLEGSVQRSQSQMATGSNPAQCVCNLDNSCKDSNIVGEPGPCENAKAGDFVACSEANCDGMTCQSNTCDPSINFASEQACKDGFTTNVSCKESAPPVQYDVEKKTIQVCPKNSASCYAGTNRSISRSHDLKPHFPRIYDEEPEIIEARFSSYAYADRYPHAPEFPPHRYIVKKEDSYDVCFPTRSGCTGSRSNKKYFEGSFKVNFNSFVATFFGGAGRKWGDCGRNTCGGFLQDAEVSVKWRKPQPPSTWNCVPPRGAGTCNDICDAPACRPTGMTINGWVQACQGDCNTTRNGRDTEIARCL